MRIPLVVSALVALPLHGALAADLAERRSETIVETERRGPDRTVVTVDEIFLVYGRCSRDPDCIAPRVLPILADGQRANYVKVSIPVDPRFADRYVDR